MLTTAKRDIGKRSLEGNRQVVGSSGYTGGTTQYVESRYEVDKTLTKQAQVIETLFRIQNKEGASVPMKLTSTQAAFDRQRTNKNLIVKARQLGMSSYILALFCVECMSIPGTRAVIISHESTATQRLLDRARYYLKNMNGGITPDLGRESTREIYFPKTESSMFIGTAGSKTLGRGDTINRLHLSEYAWWEMDAIQHVAGLMQAVPKTGHVYVESTGRGMDNDFYEMWIRHEELGYKRFFRSWWECEEYFLPCPDKWTLSSSNIDSISKLYIRDMERKVDITKDQLFWYCTKLAEFRGRLPLMKQEYPTFPEEAFQASGGALFSGIKIADEDKWESGMICGKPIEYLSSHPKKGYHYVIGTDPAGGTGNDKACVEILCLQTGEQVLEFSDEFTDPLSLSRFLVDIGQIYNNAYIVPEANNHGIAVIAYLRELYPRQLLYRRPGRGAIKNMYGWLNSSTTKPEMIDNLRAEVEGLKIYSHRTKTALERFREEADGKMGGYDDHTVIALGVAVLGLCRWRDRHLIETEEEEGEVDTFDRSLMFMTYEDIFNRRKKIHSFGVRL